MPPPRELTTFRAYLQRVLVLAKDGEGELAILYQEVANDVKAKVRAHNDQVTPVELQKEIDEAFKKVALRRVNIVKTRIEAAGKLGPKAAKKTLKEAFGDEVGSASIRTSKRAAKVAANRIAGRTRVDGASVSKRLRKLDKEVSSEMAREVEKGIQQKRGILGAARKIEKLDPRDVRIPKYVRAMRDAAKTGNIDELKRLTKNHAKYIDKLGEIQPDLSKAPSKYSMRAATKRFVKDIEKAGPEGVDAIVDRYVKERSAFRANTIARHETVEAFRRSYIEQNKNKPGVYGMKWVLSPTRHKVADECDVYANQNAYGLGPGVYPVDKVPKHPHPNCICSVVVALDRKHFRRQRADNDNALPDELRDEKSPDALAWLKGNDAAAAQILGPTRHRMLKDGVNVLDAEGKPRLVKDLTQVGAPKAAVGAK